MPESVGLSLALLADGSITLKLVASSDAIAVVDAVQYVDGGLCVRAAHEDRTLNVTADGSFSEDGWLMYARASAGHGLAKPSATSLPPVSRRLVRPTVSSNSCDVRNSR